MRGLGGFVLLAGIGVGLFVYFPAPVDRDTSLEQAQRVMATRVASSTTVAPSTTQVAPTTKSTPSRVASFAPTRPLPAPQRKSRVAATPAVPAAPVIAAAVPVETIPAWTTNVSPAATVGGPQGSLDPTDPESRYKLVVDIQQQLKRVGCYWGRVNGSWNNNTREAMRSFTMHTNAALPVEKPDYLLLSLLQSHDGRSCGAPETTVVARAAWQEASRSPPRRQRRKCCRGRPAAPRSRQRASIRRCRTASSRLSRCRAAWPSAARGSLPPAVQAPLIPGTPPGTAPGQPGVATAALDPGGAPPASVSTPSAGPKPRQAKKSESLATSRAGNATL